MGESAASPRLDHPVADALVARELSDGVGRRSAVRRAVAWWSVVIAAAAVVPYLRALRAGFAVDDFGLVVQNPLATPDISTLAWVAREATTMPLWRPLTMATYALNRLVSPLPFGFHLTSIVLHALASLAAFHLARRLVGSTSTAALVALLFAVHPIHADAVANLAGRAEVLAGLQSLASLVAFLRSWEGERPIAWTAVSLVAFGAAVLSNESAIVTIGLAPLVAIRVVRPAPWALARRL